MSLPVDSGTRTASSPFWLLSIVGIFIAHAWYLWCAAEDAFISLRFSENLAAGHGFTWNVGAPPVEGYTNFLWVVLCAGAIKLGLNPLLFAQAIGVASGIGLILLTYHAGRELLGWPEPVALVPSLLLACAGPLATWATSGMEMTLFAFLAFASTFVIARAWQRREPRDAYGAALLLFLTTLSRPEGLIIATVLFGLSVLLARFERKSAPPGLAAASLIFVALFAAYFAWRYQYFGYPLPNTFYAKTGGGSAQVIRGAILAFIFYMQFAMPLLPWLLVAAWEGGIPTGVRVWQALVHDARLLLFGGALLVSYTAYTIAVGGDYMAMHRFYVPVLPFLYLLSAACDAPQFPRAVRRPQTGAFALILAITTAGTFFPSTPLERAFFASPPQQHGDQRGVLIERWHVARLSVIGKFFRGYRRDYSESLATNAIGCIGYYSDMVVYDVHGLVDTHIAHLAAPSDFIQHLPGHGRSDLAYTLSQRPTYFMFPRDLTATPVELWRDVPEALRDQINREYVHRSVWLDDPVNGESGYFTFFERRDSAAARASGAKSSSAS